MALVTRSPNDQGSSGRNGAARTQESWVQRNPKGKGCPTCGRVHKYGQCPAFGQMVESDRGEEECLLIKLEKIGRKLLAVLSAICFSEQTIASEAHFPVRFGSNM